MACDTGHCKTERKESAECCTSSVLGCDTHAEGIGLASCMHTMVATDGNRLYCAWLHLAPSCQLGTIPSGDCCFGCLALALLLQKFDAAKLDFENGVFLGPIAFLTFNGPYAMKGKQLTFDVASMNIGLGPWRFSIPLKKDAQAIQDRDPK